MHPTIKQLKYFIALVEYRHFGKAAAACFISQSAFSVAIKELENTLKVQLVDRSNQSVVITAEGQAVARQARICISDIDALVTMANPNLEPLSGKLTLGVIPTIAPYVLPEFIATVQSRYPKLKLYLIEGKTDDIHALLQEGQLDLILVALPYRLRHVSVMTLFQDPFLFACAQGSQWLQNGKLALDALAKESVLLLEDGHCLREHALAACAIRESEQVSRFAATSLHTMLQMVAADIGITFVPQMAMPSLAATTHLEFHPMPSHSYREIGLGWRTDSNRSEEFTLLGQLLQELHLS